MARKKSATAFDSPPSDADDNRIEDLTSTVDTLAQEVRVLREAVDELRELLDWTMKNREVPASNHPLLPITSFPLDPLDKDFGEKINRTKPDDLPDDAEPPGAAAAQGELF